MASETAVDNKTETTRPKVLVVDDEYGPRESIAFTLGTEFEVDTAERAVEAIEKIKAGGFSVVILDIRMPEMDGIKALGKIREIDPQVAVVMLTGYGTLHTAQQAMLGGANQYLRKPPDIEELLEAVRKQAEGTEIRRKEAYANAVARELSSKLKREIEETEPQVWQGRASVELVHDLANPLTVMIGYAGLIGDEAKKLATVDRARAEKLSGYASIVERASEYCHYLAENWRQSTRKLAEFSDVDLVALAREVREVIFFSNAGIVLEGMGTAVVRGSSFELARVFQNLFRNALEAEATELTVRFTRRNDRVEVAVVDNGKGMDADTAKNALKGGFSTKEHGTGLGLSICRHLTGSHGAELSLESEPGKGTCIRILFPSAS